MKKLLLLSLAAASCSAFAQVAGPTGLPPQTPAGQKHGDRLGKKEMARINEEILAKLNLTDDQKTKLKTHEEEMKTKLAGLRKAAKGSANPEEAKEKVKEIRKENQAFMKSVLTKEQMREMMRLRREAVKDLQEKRTATPAKP